MIREIVQKWLYPELKRFTDEPDREKALKKLQGRIWANVSLACFVASGLILGLLSRQFGLGRAGQCGVLVSLAFLFGVGPWFLLRQRVRRQLRAMLVERGEPICIPCGYNLTGNESGKCPECGKAI